MLVDLSIRDFAIINNIHIGFSEGFTVLSGETGAGKSIIINAVKLILGGRTSIDIIKTGKEYAEVEAFFELGNSEAIQAMQAQGLDHREGLIVRRIVARNGKNKAFINGHSCTLQMMARITEKLVNISGQHAHQTILGSENHLGILDEFAGLTQQREEVRHCHAQIVSLAKKLKNQVERRDQNKHERELLEFEQKEIRQANPSEEEESEIEQEKNRLKNAELIYATIGRCIERLYGSEGSVVEWLTEVAKDIEDVGKIDPKLNPVAQDVFSAAYSMEDCVAELRSYIEMVSFNADRLEEIEERLNIIYKLKKKYGKTIEDILNYLDTIRKRLEQLQYSSETTARLEDELLVENKSISEIAVSLSEKRKKWAGTLEKMVEDELRSLEMKGVRFEILFEHVKQDSVDCSPYLTTNGMVIDETGLDRISFLISANVGEETKPIVQIASGGELSRIILALKVIIADKDEVGTILFDEVDSGIGGGVAETVGQKMKQLSKHHQVICITHLPQIASLGDHHFRISKKVEKEMTYATIDRLDGEGRVTEIARMLGGIDISEKTLDHAREMLSPVL
ncbi:MAG: DNA repair protein RecN [Deltaproteobacteria bacterium]|jgi:DNA repair protein RecN (Recombination protein N)|nr:DNA repair protein RecN [Deltaproteobacteria bacterium]